MTSNVDGHFQRAGFAPEQVNATIAARYEITGRAYSR
jgi:hypothetical protein